MPEREPVVLSVICTPNGAVTTVLRDDLQLLDSCRPHCHLREIVDPAGAEKVWNFLAEVKLRRAAADWSFNVLVNGKLETLYFAGAAVRDELAVVAALNREGMEAYFEELMQINNEHANALRTALKEQSIERRDSVSRDLYHELMQLNNELANTQRELAKKNAELGQLNAEKNRFLGMAAHDLRTPLNVIFGYGEMLRNEWNEIADSERAEMIDRITESGRNMLNLVDSMLTLSNLEASSLELDLQSEQVSDLLMDAASQLVPMAERRQVSLLVDTPDEMPAVQVDGSRIGQALMNLLSHAMKTCSPNSELVITARPVNERVEISMSYDASGESDTQIRLMLHPAGSARAEGAMQHSLGLLIARRIVEAHGSALRTSRAENRTTFSFDLKVSSRAIF
jgi:signal transduction histidine kinase